MNLVSSQSVFCTLLVAITGCATQQGLTKLEGKGRIRTYDAPFSPVWAAAVTAAQTDDLYVLNADKNQGYIAAKRGIHVESFGENVGIWVRPLNETKTKVEVVSRQAGPPVLWMKNWEQRILGTIEASLSTYEPRPELGQGGALQTGEELRDADQGGGALPQTEQEPLDELIRREQLKREQGGVSQ